MRVCVPIAGVACAGVVLAYPILKCGSTREGPTFVAVAVVVGWLVVVMRIVFLLMPRSHPS